MPFEGAIFDVDGVLVDSPHERAWRESLRELMETEWSDIRDRTPGRRRVSLRASMRSRCRASPA